MYVCVYDDGVVCNGFYVTEYTTGTIFASTIRKKVQQHAFIDFLCAIIYSTMGWCFCSSLVHFSAAKENIRSFRFFQSSQISSALI